MSEERHTTDAISPGEIIAEEIRARHWTPSQFALFTGWTFQKVCEILGDKRHLLMSDCVRLGEVFGTGATLWLNLSHRYRAELRSRKS